MDVKFRRRAPAILIVFSAVIICAMTIFMHELTDVMVEAAEASSFKLMRSVLTDVVGDNEEAALVRAELVSSLPAVRKAFAKRDRDALLAECKDMFAEQKEKYGMDEGQFHTPPGVSFLRLHAPTKFGDDQSKSRPMLVDVIKNKAHKHGIVLAPTGVFVSAIVPMEDMDDKLNGSFEMGLAFAPVLDEMKKAYGMETAVFIDEKMLREIAVELKGDVISDKNRVGKYMRYYSTHTDLLTALVKDTDVDVTEVSTYDRMANGSTWNSCRCTTSTTTRSASLRWSRTSAKSLEWRGGQRSGRLLPAFSPSCCWPVPFSWSSAGCSCDRSPV
jgi:methyl-accepting chemotaxis protein